MRTRDFEERVRDALRVRAADVVPDPRTWRRVQERARRGSLRRWGSSALVGAAAAALVALVIVQVGVPVPRVELEAGQQVAPTRPGGAPTAPGAAPSEAGAAPAAPGRAAAYAAGLVEARAPGIVVADGGSEASTVLYSDDTPVDVVRPRPGATAGEATVAFRSQVDCAGELGVVSAGATTSVALRDGCPPVPVWSPDGDALGWVGPGALGPFDFSYLPWPTEDAEPFGAPVDAGGLGAVHAEDWVWTSGAPGQPAEGHILVTGHANRGVVGVFFLPVARNDRGGIEVTGPLERLPDPEGTVTLGVADSHHNDYAAVGPEYRLRAAAGGGAAGGPRDPQLVRSADGDQLAAVALPADVIDERAPGGSSAWITARGDTVLVGDGFEQAWRVEWLGDGWGDVEPLPGAIRFAAPLGGASAPGSGSAPPAGTAPAAPPAAPEAPTAAAEQTRRALIAAAEARSYEQLAGLLPEDGEFTSNFGGQEDHLAFYRAEEANGVDVFGTLAEILLGEPAPVDGGRYRLWAWPRAYTEDPEYEGYRAGIDEFGTWRYFVAGD